MGDFTKVRGSSGQPTLSQFLPLTTFALATLLAGTVAAAPPAGDGAAAEGEASGEASASVGASGSKRGVRYSARGRGDAKTRWIYRWAPERNMGEIGIFGGVWFPNRELELFEADLMLPDQGRKQFNRVAPDLGVRFGYYPLRFFGMEVEGAFMPTKTVDGQSAFVFNPRGHVVGQLGLWSITPFVLLGAGGLGVSSDRDAVGTEVDISIHYGGGVKFFINRYVMLRLDIRDIVTNRIGVAEGSVRSPEVLLGLSLTLGRKKDREEARAKPNDRDGDRVIDEEDFCPDVYGEMPRGCPTVCVDDDDADGLMNPEDQCPQQPETRNGYQDGDGCPDEVPPELADLTGIMEGVNFDTDSDRIKTDGRENLDRAVEILKKYPDLRVEVSGHTDSKGGYRYNVDLSQRRADSVKQYMVDAGVDGSRIETRGAGPDEAIDTNETAEGRARNRRIEFKLLEEGPAKIETRPNSKPSN